MIEGEEEEEEMLLANGMLPGAAATPLPLSYQYTRIKPGILPLPYTAAAAAGRLLRLRLRLLAALAALAIQPSACLLDSCSLVSHALLEARGRCRRVGEE